jgi:signal transduction histidine kinase
MGSDDLEMGYTLLYKNYKLSNTTDSVLKYQELALLSKDSTNKKNVENLTELQKSSFAEQQRLQLLEQEKELSENRMRNYGMFGILFVFFGVGILLYRNNKREQKAKQKIEKAYDDLKSTQSQLIQSEKMASLGELTAGIAHEIQNPLNFVNNFSEVSNELLVEMKEELEKGNLEDVKAITDDVQHNLEKILHHGKRADAIVKGMLQHSRSSSGKKEPADINVLADEYLRLAYHGLRAKDKSFNSKMETDFDQTIGKINVIPQDIGRVILNLITNAFYVVDEKKKSGLANYDPMVSVSTKKLGDKIEISVKDNGNGIPEKVLAKIFQPFFTTKPTGQGTGLGLSLSYDIVKAHGGDLSVETKEGEGTAFKIILFEKEA